jgi:hypothetical protein
MTRRRPAYPSVQEGLEQQHEGAGRAGEEGLEGQPPAAQSHAVAGDEADSGEEDDRHPEARHDRRAEVDTRNEQDGEEAESGNAPEEDGAVTTDGSKQQPEESPTMAERLAEGMGVRVGEPVDHQDSQRGEEDPGVVRVGMADDDEESSDDDRALDELGGVEEKPTQSLLGQPFLAGAPRGIRLLYHSISMPSLKGDLIGWPQSVQTVETREFPGSTSLEPTERGASPPGNEAAFRGP